MMSLCLFLCTTAFDGWLQIQFIEYSFWLNLNLMVLQLKVVTSLSQIGPYMLLLSLVIIVAMLNIIVFSVRQAIGVVDDLLTCNN